VDREDTVAALLPRVFCAEEGKDGYNWAEVEMWGAVGRFRARKTAAMLIAISRGTDTSVYLPAHAREAVGGMGGRWKISELDWDWTNDAAESDWPDCLDMCHAWGIDFSVSTSLANDRMVFLRRFFELYPDRDTCFAISCATGWIGRVGIAATLHTCSSYRRSR